MLGRLPLNLVAGLIAGEAGGWVRKAKRNALAGFAIAFFGVTAWALLVAAAVALAAETHGLPASLLAGALMFLALAVLVVAIVKIVDWRNRAAERERRARTTLMASAAAAVASTGVIRSRPLLFLVLALGAGVVAGAVSGGRHRQDP
ncbi:hypothetical protein GC173_14525 [bacterium]|nr:hypothetical protein [bacterium]